MSMQVLALLLKSAIHNINGRSMVIFMRSSNYWIVQFDRIATPTSPHEIILKCSISELNAIFAIVYI